MGYLILYKESKFYCFGGIETKMTISSSFGWLKESKFYCFGGIETLSLEVYITSAVESKFYCFGGIET